MRWRIRTAGMFVMMSFILLAIGLFVGYMFDSMWLGFIIMMTLAVIFNLYAYFFSKKRALKANKVKLVTEAEEPRLYKIVKGIAEKAGVPMPEVGVSEEIMPNAFATGRNPKNAAVVATRGLLQMLPDDQLEGVMAHEMAHVKNRDILVMSVASTMAAVLSFFARYAIYMVIFGGKDQKSLPMLAIAIAMSITVPIAAGLVQLGVSRNREFLADETGARITGNPRALAAALRSIERGVSSPKNDYNRDSYANMWISNPIRKKSGFSRLFSTHPPMDDRVARLLDLAAKMEGGKVPKNEVPERSERRSASDY